MERLGTFLVCILLASCTTPVSHVHMPMIAYDKDTEYGIEEHEDGFAIAVYYSRFQFLPESDALAASCKSQLTAIAWERADRAEREIEPINEQRIRLSMGRNELTGITSCQADTFVKWKQVSNR